MIFTALTFFFTLQKWNEITMPYTSFYLECPFNFFRSFFSVCDEPLSFYIELKSTSSLIFGILILNY